MVGRLLSFWDAMFSAAVLVSGSVPTDNLRDIAMEDPSGDSWMYPYQRTPMGNPYISPIYPYIVGVYGLLSPRIPI